jgi:long-chain acyl-CoA synthetase
VNLATLLTSSARRRSGATALRLDGREVSYHALDAASARMAALLTARGVRPGDRVGVMLPNVPEFAIAYYGVLRAGGVVVPMNVLLKVREIAYHLADAGARMLLAWHGFAEEAEAGAAAVGVACLFLTPGELQRVLARHEPVRELAARDDHDTAVILSSSGTTGRPKGAELTHANLRRNAEAVVAQHAIDERTVTLGALPLFHSFGQTCSLNATIAAGGCLTLLPRFDPGEALAAIERDRVSLFQGVPTMYAAMLAHPDRARFDVSALRECVSGGAPMPAEVQRGFETAFGCAVLEGYGLSETSPVAASNRSDRPRRPGTIGSPIDGVEMRVVGEDGRELPVGDVGEIVIRGHNVMKGYWGRPEATAEAIDGDGWFHSGDLGRVDEDGCFTIVDRKKDIIIRGGYNVYPREVEEVLHEHPAVREAAVVGVPHARLGEEVGAAVALAADADGTGPEELREWVRARVAAYKYPRHVWLVAELPKGPTGKVLKREIAVPEQAVAR